VKRFGELQEEDFFIRGVAEGTELTLILAFKKNKILSKIEKYYFFVQCGQHSHGSRPWPGSALGCSTREKYVTCSHRHL